MCKQLSRWTDWSVHISRWRTSNSRRVTSLTVKESLSFCPEAKENVPKSLNGNEHEKRRHCDNGREPTFDCFFPSYATSLRFVIVAILSFATVCFNRGNLMTISDTDRDVWPILISVIQLLFRCSTSYACQPYSFSPCKVFWATKIGSNRRKSVTLSQIFQESGRLFLEARFKSGERLHMRFAITICRADNNRRNRADESSCLNPALHDMGRLAPSPPATSTVLVACQIQPNQVTRIKNARMLLP